MASFVMMHHKLEIKSLHTRNSLEDFKTIPNKGGYLPPSGLLYLKYPSTIFLSAVDFAWAGQSCLVLK